MKYIELDNIRIAYEETGSGIPVILLHCSSASHKEWKAFSQKFCEGYKLIMPDFIGYGDSDFWPEERAFDPYMDVKVVRKLADFVSGPFHLVGHSYGGAMALEAARHISRGIKSMTLIEPVAFHLLRIAGKTSEWSRMIYMSKRVRDYVDSGHTKKAASLYMGFWVGYLRWLLMAGKRKKYILDTMPKVADEFSIMERVRVSLADYAKIQIPARLIMGSKTRHPAKVITDILLRILPDVELKIVKGAGHMSPFTHSDEVNSLIIQHIYGQEMK